MGATVYSLYLFPFSFCLVSAALLLLMMPAVARALRLSRTNYAGQPISTGYGIVLWLPGAVALVWDATRWVTGAAPAATALVIFGLIGLADDIWGDRSAGGFRGHLRQLVERGRLTTGLVKLAIGGGAALALGLWLAGDAAPQVLRVLLEPSTPTTGPLPPLPDLAPRPPPVWVGLLETLTGAAVIALGANTLNLLDLRPLRTLKAFGTGSALLLIAAALAPLAAAHLPRPPAWWPFWLRGGWAPATAGAALLIPVLAAAVLYLPLEARRRAMMGDTGANALGSLLGVAACVVLPLLWQTVVALALLGLNLYAESHSLSAVIQSHPALDRLDRWGWRKVEP